MPLRSTLFALVLVGFVSFPGCGPGPGDGAPPGPGPGPGADAGLDVDPTLPEGPPTPPHPTGEGCAPTPPACSSTPPATVTEAGGLVPLERCAHTLVQSPELDSPSPLLAALEQWAPRVSVEAVVADGNRSAAPTLSVPGAPAGVTVAFRWNAEDDASTRWIPQGLTGSADAHVTGLWNGRRVLVASVYDATEPTATEPPVENKGVRLAFFDVTDPTQPSYRLVLLVEPTGTVDAPSFAPVRIHAGGIAWFQNLLYVADTRRGFRVFDLTRFLQVQTDEDVIGCAAGVCRAGLYKYALPEVARYGIESACKPIFSFVSLDRSSSPPALVSGEDCSTTACAGPLTGRVFRWPLDPVSGRLAHARTHPKDAYWMGHRQVQGAAAVGDTFYLSSSAPAGGGGALYRARAGASATSTWVDTPEDLLLDPGPGLLWSLSEKHGERVLFGAKLSSYPAP